MKDAIAALVVTGASFTGHWESTPRFTGSWESPQAKVAVSIETDREVRIREYWEACQVAKSRGEAAYFSDGKEGTKQPRGSYRLVWKNNELLYEESFRAVPRIDEEGS